jgi:hypothetical protein
MRIVRSMASDLVGHQCSQGERWAAPPLSTILASPTIDVLNIARAARQPRSPVLGGERRCFVEYEDVLDTGAGITNLSP